MSHFAKVYKDRVINVIVAEQDFIDGYRDDPLPGKWVQCSYNTHGGVHYGTDGTPDGGVAMRKNFPGKGSLYHEDADAFSADKPFDSWVLDATTYYWVAPVAYPSAEDDANGEAKSWHWNEGTQAWDESTPHSEDESTPHSDET